MIRISPAAFGDDPANWTHSAAAYAPRDVIWDGSARVGRIGDGVSWDDPNNWTVDSVHDVSPTVVEGGGGITPASRSLGDQLTFPRGTTAGTIDLGNDRFVNSLSFHDNFTLGGDAALTVSSGVVTVEAGFTATINVDLVSSRGIVKKGDGTLVIGGEAADVIVESGTVSVVGRAGSLEVQSGTLNVAGATGDVHVLDGSVTASGAIGNIEVDAGSLAVDGSAGDVIARNADVVVNGTTGATTVHSGTLVVNGTAGLTEIGQATLTGSGTVNGLNVASGGTMILSPASGVITVNGQASIEGSLIANLERDSLPMDVFRRLAFSPGSALELRAAEKLGVAGELYWKVASSARLKGTFTHEPAINSHIGHGVFVGEIYQAETAVVYHDNSVWAVLRQAALGDADGDGRFDQIDLVFALQGAKYQTGQPADWTEGDWNDDGLFDRNDVVAALQSGKYRA